MPDGIRFAPPLRNGGVRTGNRRRTGQAGGERGSISFRRNPGKIILVSTKLCQRPRFKNPAHESEASRTGRTCTCVSSASRGVVSSWGHGRDAAMDQSGAQAGQAIVHARRPCLGTGGRAGAERHFGFLQGRRRRARRLPGQHQAIVGRKHPPDPRSAATRRGNPGQAGGAARTDAADFRGGPGLSAGPADADRAEPAAGRGRIVQAARQAARRGPPQLRADPADLRQPDRARARRLWRGRHRSILHRRHRRGRRPRALVPGPTGGLPPLGRHRLPALVRRHPG